MGIPPRESASEKPAQEREHDADKNAGNNRKIEREIPFLNRNVTWEFAEPDEQAGEAPQHGADDNQGRSDQQQKFPNLLHTNAFYRSSR